MGITSAIFQHFPAKTGKKRVVFPRKRDYNTLIYEMEYNKI